MTTALVSLEGVAKLAAIATRLIRETPAPEPASVCLTPGTSSVSIQPSVGRDPVTVIGSLLVWTHSLTGLHGDWWHTSAGDLHITLHGRGPSGARVKVYSSFPYSRARKHLGLRKGDHETVTPDELYLLALEIAKQKENDQ
ncbi:hypothetical protein SD37_31700 [Amycolatopsis orientalis]|uniref:Uncharacterized protein n=1 Tax=Amycolatopsis orientalis TaxID=31958 RepID=A0A193C585_AMYOR|nr:hypothetical protein [Amycolatopsis orientalis]ANN19736.1 hypothetical protein SD37_31700 [Amycolatopsis orientalis]